MRFLRKLLLGKEGEERLRDLERQGRRMERRVRSLMRLGLQAHFGRCGLHAPGFDPFRLSLHSQDREDGMLIRTFSEIGVSRHSFVEIGIQDGLECNSACLALGFGWRGVMVEGDPEYAARARKNYAGVEGVTIHQAFVTRENVQAVLDRAGADRDCDLFSLDIDGNDYWVWEALDAWSPRVAVAEYNRWFGFDRAVTIPYDAAFRHRRKTPRGYAGASLPAFVKLAARRQYVLTGVCGYNAVFVRRSELKGGVREVSIQEAAASLPPDARTERVQKAIRGLPLVEV